MSTDARMESLENQVRVLKRFMVAMLGLLVAGASLAATSLRDVPDVIRAGKFEVVNDDGQAVVQLGVNKAGGLVQIQKADGNSVIQLTAHPEGGSVSAHNGQGKTLVLMGGNEHGAGAFQTRNSKGQTLVVLGTNQAGEGIVFTENGKGGKTSEMPNTFIMP